MKKLVHFGLIYGAYCIISKKWYVGQTIRDFDIRKDEHIRKSYNEKDDAYYHKFHCAIRKYGIENFIWYIIEDNILVPYYYENCEEIQDRSLLNEREIYWVDYYNSFKYGYNMTPGGNQNSVNGVSVLQYTKSGVFVAEYATMGQAERDNKLKLGRIAKGFYHGWKSVGGYIWIKKTVDDYPLTISSYKNPNSIYRTKYIVLQYTVDGEFIAEYNGFNEIGRKLGLNGNYIRSAVITSKNRISKSYGFIWMLKQSNTYSKIIKPYCNPKKVKIHQLNTKGEFIKEYNSVTEASRELGIPKSNISYCLTGKRKTAGGYIWKYAEI